jgi:broad specificity phosphatase PhoE
MVTRMIFIRHGDTGYPWGVFVGSSDVGLAEGALDKARELGVRLKPEGVSAIYSSRLKRAWKTAEAIGSVLSMKPARIGELNEVDFGKWELKKTSEVEKEYSDQLAKRKADPWRFGPPGGENFSQVRDRVLPAILNLFDKHEGRTFVVVSHGTLLRVVYASLTGVSIQEAYKKGEIPFLTAMFFKKDGDKIVLEKTWGM